MQDEPLATPDPADHGWRPVDPAAPTVNCSVGPCAEPAVAAIKRNYNYRGESPRVRWQHYCEEHARVKGVLLAGGALSFDEPTAALLRARLADPSRALGNIRPDATGPTATDQPPPPG